MFPSSYIAGHAHSVRTLEFNPCASGLLASSSVDMTVRIFDLEGQTEACCLRGQNTEPIFSTSWSKNGGVLVTTSTDRKLRVLDPRADTSVAEVTAHAGTKGQRAVWCGDSFFIFSVGTGSMAQREFKLWDCRKLSGSTTTVQTETIDNGGGNLLPLHDEGTGIIYGPR